jgi:multimeric flavodoxin WrbA
MGSPHKGNTFEITQRIEKKLKEHSDVEFEYVHLKDLDIQPCKGCFLCFVKGEDCCPVKDDKEMIMQKMAHADGVIFVSPVYSMHVTYLFKTFIDRIAYNFHRPCYFGKYAITVAATGGIGLEDALKYLKMVATSTGFAFVDELGFIAPPKNTSYKKLIVKKDRTEEVVTKFYTAIKENKPRKLTLSDYIHFHSMRTVYSRLETMSPVDYKYFKDKGWNEKGKKYFCDNVKGNFLKERIAAALGWYMGRQIDKAMKKSIE